jgi:hypothetical protein
MTERETFGRTALGDPRSIRRELLGAQAVFFAEVLRRVGTGGTHRRVQLEGLEVHFDVAHVRANARQGALEGVHADRAPRARNIGYDIDSHADTSDKGPADDCATGLRRQLLLRCSARVKGRVAP